jgi:hypothetical protein
LGTGAGAVGNGSAGDGDVNSGPRGPVEAIAASIAAVSDLVCTGSTAGSISTVAG